MIVYSKVTEAPESEPVSLSEAKIHLEFTGSSKDAYITTLISVARRLCESYSGLSFVTQTRTVKLDRFPASYNGIDCINRTNPYGEILLPYGPVNSVTTFTYIDSDGASQTLTVDVDYTLDNHSALARVRPIDGWPSTKDVLNAVSIEYECGYADDADELDIARQAILLQVATLFENRQDEVVGAVTHEINWNSKTLLDSIKVYWNANQD